MSLFHTAKHIGSFIGAGFKAAKLINQMKPDEILSEQELESYLRSSCEVTNEGLPKDVRFGTQRFEKVYVTPGQTRSITFQSTRLDLELSFSSSTTKEKISTAAEEHRTIQLNLYRTGDGFNKVCRANRVVQNFVVNDKNGKQLWSYSVGPSDLE